MAKRKKDQSSTGLIRLMDALDKRFGKGTLLRMNETNQEINVFPTGSIGLDRALGVGGLPFGRIVEIFGPESSGKTTMTLHAIAQAQAAGKVAAFIDAEHALDLGYAKALGVDPTRLLVSQPDCGEDALQIAEEVAKSGEVGLIVIDSVAALTPRVELDGEMSDAQVGVQARLMGKALRKLTACANQSGTTIIFINQLRQKIGVMFGSSETTTGGNALKFYASVRLDIRRISTLKDSKGAAIANRTRVKVIKNKMAPPFGVCEFDICYGRGVCREGEVIDYAVAAGVIDKSGAWYSFEGERLGQGRENVKLALKNDKALSDRVEAALAAHGRGDAPIDDADSAAAA